MMTTKNRKRVQKRRMPTTQRRPMGRAPALLLLRDVEKELADRCSVPGEVMLKGIDVLVAMLPDILLEELARHLLLLEQLAVHSDHEDLLVVGAVEDADAPPFGERLHAAPEVVMVELLVRWSLEGVDLAALRVHAAHDVLDRAILPGRVHGLKDQEKRPAVLRVEPLLEAAQELYAVLEELASLLLLFRFEMPGVRRIGFPQTESLAIIDSVGP
jgi:hypothetical protein